MRVKGRVRMNTTGRTKAFTSPSSTAAAIRLPVLRTSIPCTSLDATHRPAMAKIARRMNQARGFISTSR